jgi:H3 lysine-79-specific histone-lysine N-methyltransferase
MSEMDDSVYFRSGAHFNSMFALYPFNLYITTYLTSGEAMTAEHPEHPAMDPAGVTTAQTTKAGVHEVHIPTIPVNSTIEIPNGTVLKQCGETHHASEQDGHEAINDEEGPIVKRQKHETLKDDEGKGINGAITTTTPPFTPTPTPAPSLSTNTTKPTTGGKNKLSKGKSTALAKLLEDSMWYIESSQGTRARESSMKLEKLRQEKLEQRIKEEIAEPKEEPTPEELAEHERVKQVRKEKARQRTLEKKLLMEKQKEERRRKAEERKKLIAEGKLQPKTKTKNGKVAPLEELEKLSSMDVADLDTQSYYKGGEIEALLKASLYFTNQGKKFDGSRREIKPVERLAQDEEYLNNVKRVSKGKKLLKNPSPTVTVKKEAAKKKKVAKKANSATAETQDSKEETKQEETEAEPAAEAEPESEPEPEPIWFTQMKEDDDIAIADGWKFFQDFVYEGHNDTVIPSTVVHAADIIRSKIKIYRTDHPVYKLQRVSLHYPFSEYQENYLLALPKDDVQFNPFDEIGKFMELMTILYLPEDEKMKVMNLEEPDNCIVGRYIKSFEESNIDNLLKSIGEFNTLIDTLRNSGKILEYTRQKKTFSRVAVYELLNQCYSRRVLPDSKKLSNYKAFSNEVYGELMPSFLSTVYAKCGLDHNGCFIDLGSGVGNCVIQAALEFGCESYGVEIVKGASVLGDIQANEFNSRCGIFGLKPGLVKLFSEQSFIDNPPVKAIVDKCTVILVNNYLFDNELNKRVVELFQDLKVGTKIISLKPIVPATHTINWENCSSILNRLKTSKFIYEENSVSWTSKGGFYYITDVMADIVEDNFVTFRSRGSRRKDEGLEERSRSNTPMNAFTNNV